MGIATFVALTMVWAVATGANASSTRKTDASLMANLPQG